MMMRPSQNRRGAKESSQKDPVVWDGYLGFWLLVFGFWSHFLVERAGKEACSKVSGQSNVTSISACIIILGMALTQELSMMDALTSPLTSAADTSAGKYNVEEFDGRPKYRAQFPRSGLSVCSYCDNATPSAGSPPPPTHIHTRTRARKPPPPTSAPQHRYTNEKDKKQGAPLRQPIRYTGKICVTLRRVYEKARRGKARGRRAKVPSLRSYVS